MQATIQFWSEFQLGPTFADIPDGFNVVRIGREPDNDIPIESPLLPPYGLVLERTDAGSWNVTSQTDKACYVDDERLERGATRAAVSGSTIRIAPFTFLLSQDSSETDTRTNASVRAAEFVRDVHFALLDKMHLDASTREQRNNERFIVEIEHNIEDIAIEKGLQQETELVESIARESIKQLLIRGFVDSNIQIESGKKWSNLATKLLDLEKQLEELLRAIRLQLAADDDLTSQVNIIEKQYDEIWQNLSRGVFFELLLYVALCELKKQTKDMIFGYGPLEDLLRMPTVSEIMVVNSEQIYIEKNGVVESSGRRFTSDEVTETVIKRIVERVGKTIDRSKPLVDARLLDGSRVNAVIPPIALSGPCLTVRKFPCQPLTMAELVSSKRALTETAAMFLRAAVEAERNIIVSGGTGTGKTTLLNCLSEFIPNSKRIVTIEDTAELQLSKQHVVRMETKLPNAEGAGAYTIQALLKNALRMRPDRIVVGECRGPEALDMLQAMNTGHDGSLTTLHANSPADVQLRLEVLVRMATELPIEAIHRQIASAIDLIVQLKRMTNGRRIITHITEVIGVDIRRGCVRMKDIFRTEDYGASPMLLPTGCLPTFIEKLQSDGLIDLEVFFR